MDLEELDTFLAEVDLVHKQIKDLSEGNIPAEELARREKLIEDEKRKKEEARKKKELEQKRKEELELEAKRKGRPGKGVDKDYVNFCKGCFTEFVIEIPICSKCGRKTMTANERHEDLQKKLEAYKERKNNKLERKKKWENWQKTKAMFWKKTSTNYSKWDYFTSSSEEEDNKDSEPILPKNDPNFIALEKDLNEREATRKQCMAKAIKLKEQGNEYLQKGDYNKAVECYTEGLNNIRDYKELYTNRALAYLKLKNYKEAEKDCTKLLDYADVFENGYSKTPVLYFKALTRRAMAFKEMKKIEDAIKDVEEALKLVPNDSGAKNLKEELVLMKHHIEKAKELEAQEASKLGTGSVEDIQVNENYKIEAKPAQKLPKILPSDPKQLLEFGKKSIGDIIKENNSANMTKNVIDEIIEYFRKSEDLRIFAFDKGMTKLIVKVLESHPFDVNFYTLVITYIDNDQVIQEEFYKMNGVFALKKILDKLIKECKNTNFKKISSTIYDEFEEIFEIFLNFTETEKGRRILKENFDITNIFDILYPVFIKHIKKEKSAMASFMGLISNMMVISENALKHIEEKYIDIVIKDANNIILPATKKSYLKIKENLYGFIANLLRSEKVRIKFQNPDDEIKKLLTLLLVNLNVVSLLDPTKLSWIKSVEGIEAIFINFIYGTEELKKKALCEDFGLFDIFKKYLNLDCKSQYFSTIVFRAMQLLSKLELNELYLKDKDTCLIIFTKGLELDARVTGVANHTIRLLIKWFDKNNLQLIRKEVKPIELEPVIKNIREIIKEQDEERFLNSTILAGNLVEIYQELQGKFRPDISYLLELVRTKTGMIRRNAGILVAKLSKDQENLEMIRSLHGIEILASVSKFILEK